ncbi:MAG: bifunctional phosphoribosylaminoimidazolecarboxamide formyltransferase/IMP cyclohydrolase [Candidatus Latescibacteria bacterium]|nr:bifunctional phosphoribosylaminoimidazolecarboxamide formyltransferase/IMP cyclohydrolase [Candidatus Latescibacterota bacterium]
MKRALISVYDKTGIVELARALSVLGVEIISTGGTARLMAEVGIPVREVSEVTGFPEMMGGRVKTLHPRVHGGILARRDDPGHLHDAQRNGIGLIDLVVVNLYPFERTIVREEVSLDEAIEQIDIGGPAMVRSAAKNFRDVGIVTDPADYEAVVEELQEDGDLSLQTRQRLAVKAFRLTANYDAAIDRYLSRVLLGEAVLSLRYGKGRRLRYGENWHQRATVYFTDDGKRAPSMAHAEQLHGKDLSYNNYLDADAAIEAVCEIADRPGVAIIKHTNPCGYATGETPVEALKAAWEGDPVSAFGGIIVLTRPVDRACVEFLRGKRVDVIIAPGYQEGVPERLKRKGEDLILLQIPPFTVRMDTGDSYSYRGIMGGILEQNRDRDLVEQWDVVTTMLFPEEKRGLALFAWKAAKHTKSNAIVIAVEYRPGNYMVLGVGAGQPNRVDSLRKLAAPKAMENLRRWYEIERPSEAFSTYASRWLGDAVLASDAFLPFADTVESATEVGIRYLIQPGGSKKDEEVITTANRLGVGLVFTGMRHFKH